MDDAQAGWWCAAGRLSQQLSDAALPFGKSLPKLAAKGVRIPRSGVPVLSPLDLDTLAVPDEFVVIPPALGWTNTSARLVAAHWALGRSIGYVDTGEMNDGVVEWFSSEMTSTLAPVVAGSPNATLALRAGQVSEVLDFPALVAVVDADCIRQFAPPGIADGLIVVTATRPLDSSTSRAIAALRAHAQRLVVVMPSDCLTPIDSWLANVDVFYVTDHGDVGWRPEGSTVESWRSVDDERAAQKQAKESREAEKAKQAALQAQRELEVQAQAAAARAERERVKKDALRLKMQGLALADMRKRGVQVPATDELLPDAFWTVPCPWCEQVLLVLWPVSRSTAGVICSSCGKKSRRSACLGCKELAVVQLGGVAGEKCDHCRTAAPPPQARPASTTSVATAKPAPPSGWRKWFSRG